MKTETKAAEELSKEQALIVFCGRKVNVTIFV
jgi:hypothetical protein